MAIQLGSAYGKVSLDVKGLRNSVQQGVADLGKLQKAGALLGSTLKNVGNALTIGVTLPILAMGGASVRAASDFEETKNKAVVVFGEMADSVVTNANKAATAFGLSKTQYLDYASSLGAAFTAGGLGVKESTVLAEQAVKHFADLASFHNARVEDVADAWQSAIRGQYEPIQRYFPFITNEYLKTYGTANGLIDSNTKNLTANQRAIILNAIALDEKLNPAVDDFAETSGGLANQGRILQAQWQNALITLGQNLLPIALRLVTALNSLLEKFNQLNPTQQKMVLGFLAIAAAIGPVLSALGTLISAGTSLIGLFGPGGLLAGAGATLAGLGTSLTATVLPALAALGAALLPILIVLLAIGAYIGYLAILWKTNFLGFRDNVQTFIKIVTSLWKAFTAFLRGDTEAATQYLQEAWQAFVDRFNQIFERIFNIQNAWQRFTDFLRTALARTVQYIRDSFARIDWSMVGKYILLGIGNGMLGGIPGLIVIAGKVAKTVLDTIKKDLGIASESKKLKEAGMWARQGFYSGFLGGPSAEDTARALVKPIVNNGGSRSQTVNNYFSGGITTREVNGMIDDKLDAFANTIISSLSGA